MKRNHGGLLTLTMALLLGAAMAALLGTRALAQPPNGAGLSDDDYEEVKDEAQVKRELMDLREMTLDRVDSLDADLDPTAASGYAVFDATKGGLIITGTGGTGVAYNNETGEETYMHFGGGGLGLGAGLENYHLLLVFHDDNAYQEFIDGTWSGSLSGQALVGEEGVAREGQSLSAVEVYRFDDAGAIAQVDLTGVRFWPSDDLNEDVEAG